MSPRDLIVMGGGEHARVLMDAIQGRPAEFRLLGFVDPAPCEETVRRLRVAHLGTDAVLGLHSDAALLLGVGPTMGSDARERLAAAFSHRDWPPFAHASALVSPSATLDRGAVVMARAVVHTGARIGAFATVNTASVVEHDVSIGDFCHLAPGVVIGGGVSIGARSFVGLGACIRDHVRIGAGAVIAMGAVVVQDVPDGACVKGVPAK